MGIFGSLGKAIVNTALTPVDVAKDVFTLGGLNTDRDETYIEQRLRKIGRNLNKANDEIEEALDD